MTPKNLLLRLLYWTAKHAAASYVAGPKLEDALRVCRFLHSRAMAATICPWDALGTPPREVLASYQAAISGIAASGLDCYLSVKLPSIGYDTGMLRELVAAARPHRIRVHLDSLDADTVDPTLNVLDQLGGCEGLGFTLPSRWKRSIRDAQRVIDAGLPVRLVKGQFEAAAAAEIEPDLGFLKLIDALCGKASLVAVASHDVPLAKESLNRLRQAGTACELEQLYGLPLIAKQAAACFSISVRTYVPYDYGYLPYALSKLRREPKMVWWLIRDAVRSLSTGVLHNGPHSGY